MSRTKGPKLLVELLEDRTLMSASGWLYAADVGPIAAVKNTPITIPVLTNDMSMHGGMLSVVSTTQGMNGSAVFNICQWCCSPPCLACA